MSEQTDLERAELFLRFMADTGSDFAFLKPTDPVLTVLAPSILRMVDHRSFRQRLFNLDRHAVARQTSAFLTGINVGVAFREWLAQQEIEVL